MKLCSKPKLTESQTGFVQSWGNAAVAIRIAVDQMKANKITAAEIDLALSAVLACALEGEPASAILISSALRRRSKCDPSCKTLSELWLVANL